MENSNSNKRKQRVNADDWIQLDLFLNGEKSQKRRNIIEPLPSSPSPPPPVAEVFINPFEDNFDTISPIQSYTNCTSNTLIDTADIIEIESFSGDDDEDEQESSDQIICENKKSINDEAHKNEPETNPIRTDDKGVRIIVLLDNTHQGMILDVNPSDVIGSIKKKIEVKKNIPTDQQCLLWKGNELEDNQKLSQNNIDEESVLVLKQCISL